MASQRKALASWSAVSTSSCATLALSSRTALPMAKHMGRQSARYSICGFSTWGTKCLEKAFPGGVVYDWITFSKRSVRLWCLWTPDLGVYWSHQQRTCLKPWTVASALAMGSRRVKVAICWPIARIAGWTSLSAWASVVRRAIGRWLKHSGMPPRVSSSSCFSGATPAGRCPPPAEGLRPTDGRTAAADAPPEEPDCSCFDLGLLALPSPVAWAPCAGAEPAPGFASFAATAAALRFAFFACFCALSSALESFLGASTAALTLHYPLAAVRRYLGQPQPQPQPSASPSRSPLTPDRSDKLCCGIERVKIS